MSKSGTARMELQTCLLHYLVIHIILSQEFGVAPILRALRFTLETDFVEALGGLPMTCVSVPVRTTLPDDEAIIQTTELSGASAFEENIDIDSILRLDDPVKGALLDLVASFGDDLLPPDSGQGVS